MDESRYAQRGVSAGKEEVHAAIEGVDKGKIEQEEKRLKRRKGVQDTILTGSGLTQEQGASSTYKPTLLK